MTHRHGRRCILNLFILSVVFNTAAFAQTAVIGGSIYTGANDGSGPVLAPNALAPPIMDARVLVQNQHSGGAVITYGTVTGNTWTATVPAPGDYVVMFSAAGHDTTSREFTVAPGDTQSKDAYLPPLPVPSANLLVYSFYDNMVNGEDDAPDDPPLNGVTFMAWDDDGDLLATGISGSQPVITLSTGQVITNTAGLYYFTGLPPGEVLVTSDPGTAYLADNPGLGLDATTEYYLMSSEEGGPRFEAVLYPGDPGTEAGGYIVWHGYVKKLGAIDAGNVAERFPPGTTLANAATIMGTLVDADMAFDPIEPEDALVPAMHPGVTANVLVPDGFVVLFTDDETIPTHPVATAETGASGEFTFNNVPPGKYKLFLSDIPIDYVYVQVQVAVGPNQVAALSPFTTLLPRFYARVQGFVYDNATTPPTPMSGAKVNIRYKDGAIQHTTTTDANGWYNFDDMPEIEVLAYVDVEPPPGYRGAMITDAFYPDAHRPDPACHPAVPGCVVLGDPLLVTHNGMNRYVQWFTANYRADLYVEPIPPPEVHIGGFVFNDELATGTWVGDGAYDRNDERTLHGVKVDLLDATGTTVLATTASGAFDKAATLAQGWHEPYTIPPDEWGGVFAGPLVGYYEFRSADYDGDPATPTTPLVPGDYVVKVRLPDPASPDPLDALYGYAPTTPPVVPVTVAGGAGAEVDFGFNTTPAGASIGVPLAGEIEGGVFDDLNVDFISTSLLFMEKAGIPGVPVGVYDHLGYFLGVGHMGNPLCYAGAPAGQCPPGEPSVQKPEMERRFAPGPRIYFGNDPALPGYNPCYAPLALGYTFGQGQFKFEADWSLVPIAHQAPSGSGLVCDPAPLGILPGGAPVILGVTPVGSYLITGADFGDRRGFSTVTLAGVQLHVTSWSDTEIHVDDPPVPISGPMIVTTSAGPSNAFYVDTGHTPPHSVFVDAAATGEEEGSAEHPWHTIGAALQHLPEEPPRYVFVAPGTYHEHIQIDTSDVHLIGSGPLETILDGLEAGSVTAQGLANGGGPVIFIGEGGEDGGVHDVAISGFTITGGSVRDDEIGAGIFGDYGNSGLDINNCVIVHNGGYYGGGIWLHHSNHDVRIWSNTLAENGNYGGYGGGISVNDEPEYGEEHGEPEHVWDDHDGGCPPGTYEIFNNHIFGNFSPDYGGGVCLYEVKDHLIVAGNLIEDNKADDHGGGAFFEDTGPIDMYGNMFLRNYCRDDGGAVSFEDVGDDIATVLVYNNLFAENIADDCGENHARGGALAFDDTFYAEVFNNTIVGNIVAGSYDPAGGGIDSERNGHEYNGSDPLGRDIAPGYSDPHIFNNILWGNMRLHYDQPMTGEEEDLCYMWGINYVWTPDDLHVDNPAVQDPWETDLNSESFTHVEYNDISDGTYADRPGNINIDPLFADPAMSDWHLTAASPVINHVPAATAPDRDLDRSLRGTDDGLADAGAYAFDGMADDAGLIVLFADADGDGTSDLCDGCPDDPDKIAAGVCGCGVSDVDSDDDDVPDCNDMCPGADDDEDEDDDGVPDDCDNCPEDPNPDQADADGDGDGDVCDEETGNDAPPGVNGDLDGDADVDVSDFFVFLAAMGSTEGGPAWNPDCDYDLDGIIGLPDYVMWVAYYMEANP